MDQEELKETAMNEFCTYMIIGREAKEKGLDYVEVTDQDIKAYNQEIQKMKKEDEENESPDTPLVE